MDEYIIRVFRESGKTVVTIHYGKWQTSRNEFRSYKGALKFIDGFMANNTAAVHESYRPTVSMMRDWVSTN